MLAGQVRAVVQEQTVGSFDRMAAIAQRMKSTYPHLADRIDCVLGHSMLRSMLMPEAMAALFLAQTEEPPVAIEGEVIDEDVAERMEDVGEVDDEQ
jgi:hypothetical protein